MKCQIEFSDPHSADNCPCDECVKARGKAEKSEDWRKHKDFSKVADKIIKHFIEDEQPSPATEGEVAASLPEEESKSCSACHGWGHKMYGGDSGECDVCDGTGEAPKEKEPEEIIEGLLEDLVSAYEKIEELQQLSPAPASLQKCIHCGSANLEVQSDTGYNDGTDEPSTSNHLITYSWLHCKDCGDATSLEEAPAPAMDAVAEEILTDEEIDRAWGNANFGSKSKKGVIKETLEKCVLGYESGHTAKCIVQELGLVRLDKWKLTERGNKFLQSQKGE